MGQDIHCHIEYRVRRGVRAWYNCFGTCYIERCYRLFALLGGRHQEGVEPPFPLRGVPSDLTVTTSMAWLLRVTETPTDKDRSLSRREALLEVERGRSRFVGDHHITDADFHSASWLTVDELAQVYTVYLAPGDGPSERTIPTVEAALCAMRRLAEAHLVYWFDR